MQTSRLRLPEIPPPNQRRIALRVNAAAERALRKGHPWLFANAITRQSHPGYPGDLAVIFDGQRKFLAIGLYDPTSYIRVRILQHRKPKKIDPLWFAQKIESAAQIRSTLPENTNGFRLIHGENDHLPGLVIDRYSRSLVMKLYTPAWIPYLSALLSILLVSQDPDRIIIRFARSMKHYPEFLHTIGDGDLIYGKPANGVVYFNENGLTFEADLKYGQKTGFFLDQRDNRAWVEKISKGKRVLNVFSYSGGFSVYAARGGAAEVLSLDQNRPALDAALRNFSHNQANISVAACHHQVLVGDAFNLMQNFNQSKQTFDIIIIDPPAFAKREAEIENALAAYQRLTHLGVRLLKAGGILVQASCSSRITSESFFKAIHQTAIKAGRPLKEIERTGHALDHPIGFPEGEYLKCLFATG